ncbi:MAG: MerR family DNA-binding transcriptional regulator, partial [Lapillicoccus sp.]
MFVISVAAQLAGMHAQTLRQYDRLGLVSPSRTRGGGRRYSGRAEVVGDPLLAAVEAGAVGVPGVEDRPDREVELL